MKFQGIICEILKFRRIICHWPKFHGIICILPKYKIPNISQQSSHFTSLSPNLAVSQVTASIFDAFCNFSPQQKHVVAKKSPVGSASLKSQHFVLVFWRTLCSVFVPSKMEKGVIKGNLGISHKFFFFFSSFIKKKFWKKKKVPIRIHPAPHLLLQVGIGKFKRSYTPIPWRSDAANDLARKGGCDRRIVRSYAVTRDSNNHHHVCVNVIVDARISQMIRRVSLWAKWMNPLKCNSTNLFVEIGRLWVKHPKLVDEGLT